jgi:quercetin dioxygenase-like cupin family protein
MSLFGGSALQAVAKGGERMILSRGRSGRPAAWEEEEHTGGVWVDKVWVDNIISADKPKGLRFDSVFCPPSKRTLWHRRQGSEVLIVMAGQGRVATANGERSVVQTGDAVFFSPEELHWHGAGPTTFLHYFIRSVGAAEYGEVVNDEEYLRGFLGQ